MARLFIDMDGTLAKYHDEDQYLKRMWEKDFFRNLKPFENMVAGIKEFIKMQPDVEVFIISAAINSEYCVGEKHAWLNEHLPEIPRENRLFPPGGESKARYINMWTSKAVSKDDYLLDDYNKGLFDFQKSGGTAIKCHNNINHKGLGLHGGQKGQLWTEQMVHTADLPLMIASELSLHMGLEFSIKPILEAYGEPNIKITVSKEKDQTLFICEKKALKFTNPLDLIRYTTSSSENHIDFLPVKIEDKNRLRIIPYHRYHALYSNFCADNNTTPDKMDKEKLRQSMLDRSYCPIISKSVIKSFSKKENTVDELRGKYPEGTIIELEHMDGEPQMPAGLKGKVTHVDDMGQIHTRWENGSSLALVLGKDSFNVISTPEKKPCFEEMVYNAKKASEKNREELDKKENKKEDYVK